MLLPARVVVATNSNRPWGGNDGALWQGRGVNFAASAGVSLTRGPISAMLAPVVTSSANTAFPLAPWDPSGTSWPLQPWAYPTLSPSQLIDAPQRFGPDAFTTFSRASPAPL